MDDFVIKRNTPVARLIKDFRNKQSKKVVESRKEIQRRFAYLDWKDQKKILTAFMESGKTEQFRVVARFSEWNDAVCKDIIQSEDYPYIRKFLLDTNALLNIARKYCYNALPIKYRASSISCCDNLLLPHDA